MEEAVEQKVLRTPTELVAIVEALIFVADEPVSTRVLAEVLEEEKDSLQAANEQPQSE